MTTARPITPSAMSDFLALRKAVVGTCICTRYEALTREGESIAIYETGLVCVGCGGEHGIGDTLAAFLMKRVIGTLPTGKKPIQVSPVALSALLKRRSNATHPTCKLTDYILVASPLGRDGQVPVMHATAGKCPACSSRHVISDHIPDPCRVERLLDGGSPELQGGPDTLAPAVLQKSWGWSTIPERTIDGKLATFDMWFETLNRHIVHGTP